MTWLVLKRGLAQTLGPERPAKCFGVRRSRPLGGDAALTPTSRTMRASGEGRWCLCRPAEETGTQVSQRGPRALVPRSQDRCSGLIGKDLRISDECTQDGRGGFAPQESQGRTERYSVSRVAHEHPVECAQDGQGGLSPQETQGCTSYRRSTSTTA